MSVVINDMSGEERWKVLCAPQRMTDILVQVYDLQGESEKIAFYFKLGELLLEEIEDEGALNGEWMGSDEQRALLLRWASLLECYAATMRAALGHQPGSHAETALKP